MAGIYSDKRIHLGVLAILILGGCTRSDDTAAPSAPHDTAQVHSAPRAASLPPACTACHSNTRGEAHKAGPNLHAIMGRRAGTASGYTYSEAMQRSRVVWDAQSLDAFLQAPTRVVPGSRMTTRISDPAERKRIVGLLAGAER